MANTDNPSGFQVIGLPIRQNYYTKNTAAAIYKGEAVIMASTGLVGTATAGGVEILGVALGHAKATDTSVLLADDPRQEYYIQDDGVGGTLAATSVGLNADIVATAGNATFLKAQQELDTSTAATSTFQLRILGKHPDDSWADNVRCRVTFNEFHLGDTVGI